MPLLALPPMTWCYRANDPELQKVFGGHAKWVAEVADKAKFKD
jgi:hypothetical protein